MWGLFLRAARRIFSSSGAAASGNEEGAHGHSTTRRAGRTGRRVHRAQRQGATMSQSLLSAASAGLLLAAGALAATKSADTPVPVRLSATSAAPRWTSIALFVSVRDINGDLLGKPTASVETPGSDQPQVVGPDGIRLSVPAGVPSDLRVLVPGSACKVTLGPKMAGRAVLVVVDRQDGGTACTASDVGASAASTSAALRGAGLLDALF